MINLPDHWIGSIMVAFSWKCSTDLGCIFKKNTVAVDFRNNDHLSYGMFVACCNSAQIALPLHSESLWQHTLKKFLCAAGPFLSWLCYHFGLTD